MTLVESLLPINPNGPVHLTVTIGNAGLGGVSVSVGVSDDQAGGTVVDGAGDESSRTFELGVGSALAGKVVLCVAAVASVSGISAPPVITWSVSNARTLLEPAEYSHDMPVPLQDGAAEMVAQLRFAP